MSRLFSLALLFTLSPSLLLSQVIPFDSSAWNIEASTHVLMNYQGRSALFIQGGSAELKTPRFVNGEIQFDIAFSAQRGFSGAQWRIVDDNNGEIFYFRPHLSGMPDATQYTPVDNGLTAWQLMHGPAYGAPLRFRYNEWQHVRIVFNGGLADVYVDSDQPVLTVALTRAPAAGQVAVYASGFAPAYFANFEYRASDDVEIVGNPVALEAAARGTVMNWSVSSPFPESSLAGSTSIPSGVTSDLAWSNLGSGVDGIANLATVTPREEGQNTVLASVSVRSESASTQIVRFGYSDRVRVYLNGSLLYAGSNAYVSRDYRYLGTIGLFDSLPLSLKAGDNELLFAVSEDFGGWGVMAQFEDPDAVTLAAAE